MANAQDYSHIRKPDLGYQYEFATDDLDAMSACLDAHGFAIIVDVLPADVVEGLKQAVYDGADPDRALGSGEAGCRHAWIESGPGAWEVLEYEPFMRTHRHLIGRDELPIHRSSAIIRMSGSDPVAWHTDWAGFTDEIKHTGDVLNSGLWPSGNWFYRPVHARSTAVCVSSKIPTSRTGRDPKDSS